MNTSVYNPQSVFVWQNQVLFADTNNHRIRKILPNGSTVTIAGTGVKGYNGDDQLATMAQLDHPYCLFVSECGEVYIGERCLVRKILTNGMITTISGTRDIEDGGNDGLATESSPTGLFVSSNDEVYIADSTNHRIRKVLNNGTIITIAGTGIKGYNGDGILATNAQLFSPWSVFISNSNEVFISERSGHRIRKIDANGMITTVAGNGHSGYEGDGIVAVQSKINNPIGAVVVNGEVYIADRFNHRIRKVLKSGTIITIAGTGFNGYNGDNME